MAGAGRDDDAHSQNRLRPATRLVAAGRRADWTHDARLGGGIVNPPVWRASTILYDRVADLAPRAADSHHQLYYGRRGTPTAWALADALTALEPGADGTLLFPSGVAAITGACLALLGPGDELLCVDSAYQPTRALADGLLARLGIATRYYDPCIGGGIAGLITPATRLILIESPGSLTFEVQDVPAITAAARSAGVPTMIDNSWAGPTLFPALAHGCDIAMLSLTKYVAGHSDLLMGSLTATPACFPRLRDTAFAMGQTVAADDAALALRGLRTLDVRLARAGASALTIARWLARHPGVAQVLHPALPDDPGHALWARDFRGASGLFGLVLADAAPGARAAFIDALALFGIGYSWGGFESLVIPADPVRSCGAPAAGAHGALVRLSIGLEDPDDLIADLDQALRAAGLAG